MKHKQNILFSTAFFVLGIIFTPINIQAQVGEGHVYGKVYTVDGDIYEGYIFWDDQETFWFDLFHATKVENEFLHYLNDSLIPKNKNSVMDLTNEMFDNIFKTNTNINNTLPVFVCPFGYIKSIKVIDYSHAELIFKNNQAIEVGRGQSVGADLQVVNSESNKINIYWENIHKIEFIDTPEKAYSLFDELIYGTVKTKQGKITGFIRWDHDKKFMTDELYGETRNENVAIPFRHIRYIERTGRGVDLITNAGRKIHIWGDRDVNSDNRGILVDIPGIGKADIPWRAFENIEIGMVGKNKIPKYTDFGFPKYLAGTLTTIYGKSYSGKIIFDLDEEMNVELLDGYYGQIQYLISFEMIKCIIPIDQHNANIELITGEKIILGKTQDLSDNNFGILIFGHGENPQYFTWEIVKKIEFR